MHYDVDDRNNDSKELLKHIEVCGMSGIKDVGVAAGRSLFMNKPKLSEHKKAGDILETPWLAGDMGKVLQLSSWSRNSLPEYFWIALIFDWYGREEGLKIFSQILEECKQQQFYEPKFSAITKLPEKRQKKLYEILDRHISKEVMAPLTIIIGSENYPVFYSHYVNPSITISKKVDTIMRVTKNTMNLRDNSSTDICYIVLWFLVMSGTLACGPEVSVIGEALTHYHRHTHSDAVMSMYRSSIRATYQALSFINQDLNFCQYFWASVAGITHCNPMIIKLEKSGEICMQYYKDVQRVIEYIQATSEAKKLDKQYEVCMGITMYIVKLYREIVENDLFCKISGRILFRTMVESYFNLKYLVMKGKNEAKVYEMFQEYGRGKYKLVMSKLREGKFRTQETSHINKNVMEIYVNEEKDENFLNISLNYFDKQNLRQKIQSIGEEELYEIYYEYDTNYTHGFWGAIRESAMLICDNPAHLYHTVPDYSMEQMLISVDADCEMVMKKVFVLLSDIIELPDFYLEKYKE